MDYLQISVAFSLSMRYTIFMEKNLLQYLNQLTFRIDEANYVDIENDYVDMGITWSSIVAYYPYNRLYLITEGKATLILKDRQINLIPDHLYFIPAYSVISSEHTHHLGHYYMHFQITSALSNIPDFLDFSHITDATESDRAMFRTLCENFPAQNAEQFFLSEGAFRMLLSKPLANANILDSYATRFMGVLEYINNNLEKQLTLREIADVAHLNEKYFCQLFRKAFNTSPWDYVLNQRINKSLVLLLDKNLTVKQIAYMLGFADEFYFSRLFKKRLGISPNKFRSNL